MNQQEFLYHISDNKLHSGLFIPNVSENRMSYEDEMTKRISFAPTLEDCLSAMPSGGNQLLDAVLSKTIFKVFKLNAKKHNIRENNIIDSNELFSKNLVPDALLSSEYWVTQSVMFNDSDYFYIRVNSFEHKSVPIITKFMAQSLLSKKDFKNDFFREFLFEIDYETLVNLSKEDDEVISFIITYLWNEDLYLATYHKIFNVNYEIIDNSIVEDYKELITA